MASKKKLLQAAAGSAGGAGLDVDEVFSTYLYDGTGSGSNLTVTNNIDLSTEGGLVWVKNKEATAAHALFDTVRGQYILESQSSGSQDAFSAYGGSASASYNTNGFGINGTGASNLNSSSARYVSWTFRKAPKFFDVVTYSGSSSAQTIAHNLGVTPAVMIVKQLNSSGRWTVYHKDASPTGNPQNGRLALNTTDAWNEYPTVSSFNTLWNQTAPTSTHFTVGTNATTGASGSTYVAYLFANNNNDGEFGPNADQDIIKCGSVTIGGTGNATVNLGFEPQWLLIRNASSSGYDWQIFDTMRGFRPSPDNNAPSLSANSTSGGSGQGDPNLTSTGFEWDGGGGQPNKNYIYIAIRRGPLAEPESASDVFAIDQLGQTSPSPPAFTSGFAVDKILFRGGLNANGQNPRVFDRLRGSQELNTNNTNAETSNTFSYYEFDYSNGVGSNTGTATDLIMYMWKRAPGYFDVVAYTGDGTAGRTINHNLGVVPEMMWMKGRSNTDNWSVYHKDLSSGQFLQLNVDASVGTNSNMFTTTAPTSSVFSLGSDGAVNGSSNTYIAYLFATVAGISKVGSYTGTGSTGLNIDCGFSSGARFVMIKRTDAATYDWFIWDSVRGIVSGADKRLSLNTGNAEVTQDNIDPLSSGFTISTTINGVNQSGGTYIFYAIA